MRLIRLRLLNFRQHADTEIHFRPGLTGIVGANGAGKSTILEAIAWAIYGAAAARGTNETIRYSRAPGRSRVQVELVFELGGHEFRVSRTIGSAEVYLDGGDTPVATTLGGVTDYLVGRLGMTRDEFFNTYFTGQKELQFLAQMGAAQRGRFLGQVLGYERLRLAQERVRTRRNELRHEMEGLRSGLPDPDRLRAERAEAERRRADAARQLQTAEEAGRIALEELRSVRPEWESAQADRERDRELAHQRDVAERDAAAAERDLARIDQDLSAITRAEAELSELRLQLAVLPDVEDECRRMAELARLAERRRGLEETIRTVESDLAEGAERLAGLEQAPRLLEETAAELVALREELAETDGALDAARAEWLQRRQEAETRLETYRQRGQELKDQIHQLREAGPDGVCPTCERPLGSEFDRVVGDLEDEWETLVQDGKWLKQRLDQLNVKPPEVEAAEERRAEQQRRVDEKSNRHARCERAVQELEAVREERGRKIARLDGLRAQVAELPVGYDADKHREAEARLRELRELEHKATRFDQIVVSRPVREKEREEAARRRTEARDQIARAEAERVRLAFSEERFLALRERFESLNRTARAAELRLTEVKGAVTAAVQAAESAERALDAYEERRVALEALEVEHRHHHELDRAFTDLRAELNARVRPEFGELASSFLTEITDGRYTQMEIDESYNVLVLDEGEEKPVISGGEEDIANLVLRLAISQMIAERSGHPLSLLILDEVFASLDVERRDNVIQLLHRLEDRFEQVIIITHVETIREGLDQVIRVRFDERTGSSVVEEESFEGTAEALPDEP